MNVIRNTWEVNSDDGALLALAGHSTRQEFETDWQERARDVISWCSIKPGDRGFEIGSGEGTVASLLAPQCLSLDCNDISASFLQMARARCAGFSNVHFHKLETDGLDHLSADAYDFGFALNVFIHFNAYDIFNYPQSVKRILKRGAVFYFDACTLGEQTMALFREQAEMYRKSPEGIRGLLNYNHPELLAVVVRESGLELSPARN